MNTPRIRSVVAATAVAAVLSYGMVAHAPPMSSHDAMGVVAGLCILLVGSLSFATVHMPEQHAAVAPGARPGYVEPPQDPPLDARTRASPRALQRFRN